jgi:KDO2-lipid IV(A) lauroyltransferase
VAVLSVPVLRTAHLAARYLPRQLAAPLTSAAAIGYARFSPTERAVVERNLCRLHGRQLDPDELRRSTQQVFESYGRYWLDSLRLVDLTPDQIDDGFSYEGIHHLIDPIDAGITPVVAMPHLGGWEWSAAWLTKVKGWPVASVAERLEPPELFDWFLEFRRKLGMHIIALGPTAAAEVAAQLASGTIISLLADRDLTGDGIVVEFFGERTRLPGGPAVTALRSGAPLIPAAAYFEGDHCHAVVLPPIDTERRGKLRADVTRVTQDLAVALETLIKRAPEQWHLLQPNWPSDYDALGLERPEWLRDL